jgi:mannonate dehydratase
MHVGTQQGDSEDMLRAFAAFGVNHICGSLPSKSLDDAWTVDALSRRRDRAQAHGVALDMLPLPMSSAEISNAEMPAIFLGTNPDRDRNIDDICTMIRNCAGAGSCRSNTTSPLLGVVRTGSAPGRGTAR